MSHYDDYLKLSDVVGKRVVEVMGYVSREFGEPVFKLSAVKFEDGAFEHCEGEHDMPYVCVDVPERFIQKADEDEE